MGPAGEERLQGSRGERRLNALNPHGNIDFMLPSAGMSEYLGTSEDAYETHIPPSECLRLMAISRLQTP
jgi:hypothetical protein